MYTKTMYSMTMVESRDTNLEGGAMVDKITLLQKRWMMKSDNLFDSSRFGVLS